MKTGSCRYNFLLTDRGTVADDLIIYRKDREDFLLVVNASRRRDDFNLLSKLLPSSVEIADVSDQTAKLDLQGPESAEILISAGIAGNELPGYYRFREFSLFGVNVIISRTGYTGELGYELYFDREKAAVIWNKLLDYPDVRPAGLGARDTLRLEMGYPLYGHELDTETTPLEAGFSKLIKLEQNREFTGKNALVNSDVKKKLSGIMIKGRRACRQGAEILYNGTHAGYVTSGGFAPSLSNAVALGYIISDINPQPGMLCQINTGRAVLDGTLVELPFYKESSLKSKIG
jgi:aminomethyltransferase